MYTILHYRALSRILCSILCTSVSSTHTTNSGWQIFATQVKIMQPKHFVSGSDYVSGARTNYRNSMCPASGYVTARTNCCKPICPAPGKIGGSDCVRHIICPTSGKYAEIDLLRNA